MDRTPELHPQAEKKTSELLFPKIIYFGILSSFRSFIWTPVKNKDSYKTMLSPPLLLGTLSNLHQSTTYWVTYIHIITGRERNPPGRRAPRAFLSTPLEVAQHNTSKHKRKYSLSFLISQGSMAARIALGWCIYISAQEKTEPWQILLPHLDCTAMLSIRMDRQDGLVEEVKGMSNMGTIRRKKQPNLVLQWMSQTELAAQ